MKSKKSPGADLENKRSVFFLLGLLLSLFLVLAAFEWQSEPRQDRFALARNGVSLEKEIYLPPPSAYRVPPPPPAPQLKDILKVVDDKTQDLDDFPLIDMEPLWNQENPIPKMEDEERVPETLPPFKATEKPSFQGGDETDFRIWVLQNIIYPEIAIENGVEGLVTVQFTVNFKGYVQDILVIRAADPALAKEAVRVISCSPRWTPGKRGIREVNVVYTIPVNFVLHH